MTVSDAYRDALIAMRDRDDRNGSLPQWYRDKIDAVLSLETAVATSEEKKPCTTCNGKGWTGTAVACATCGAFDLDALCFIADTRLVTTTEQ